MLDNSIIQYFDNNGYRITSTEEYLSIRKVEEYGGCLILFIISISVFALGYSYIGILAIFLTVIVLVVYFIDQGKDYSKVMFDFSGNRLYLTRGSIYGADKRFYLSDVKEVKLQTRKFDSFTSAFKSGNKDYVMSIHLTIKSVDFVLLSLLSEKEIIDGELEMFIVYLNEKIQ